MPQEEPQAGRLPARREETVRDDAIRGEPGEELVRVRVERRMRELSSQLDGASFALLLKVLGGVNAAFGQVNAGVEIDLTEEERALYTPELQRELVTLLELARFPRRRVQTDAFPAPPADAP